MSCDSHAEDEQETHARVPLCYEASEARKARECGCVARDVPGSLDAQLAPLAARHIHDHDVKP